MHFEPKSTPFGYQSLAHWATTDNNASAREPAMTTSRKVVQQGLVLLVSNVGSGAIQVAYTFALARLLVPTDYGAYVALISAFGILGLVTSGIQPTVARRVALHGAPSRLTDAVRIATKGWATPVALATMAVSGTLIVATPSIQSEFSLASPWPVWLLAPLTALIVITPALRGTVQGGRHFTALAGLSTVDVVTRAGFGVVLGWFGGGVTGAIGAQLAGAVVGTIATFAYLNHQARTQAEQIETFPTVSAPAAPRHTNWSTYLIGAETQSMIASGCILVMLTLDAALVARFFNAEDTATYSAVTILGRSQFYLSATVATLLLPYAALPGRGKPLTALGFGLAVTGGLNTAGLLVLIAIPDLVVRVLYGQAYASAAPLLWHYGFHAMMLSLANVVATYLIASGNRSIGIVALACTAFQIAAVTLWHPTLDAVIIGLGAGSAAFLACGLLLVRSSQNVDKYF